MSLIFIIAISSLLNANNPPNIIIILADDMGSGDIQALNEKSKIPTPNLNSLAEEGIVFTDAHTNSSVCTPTRYGILTGRYCWRTSLKKGVLNGFSKALIDPSRTTIADLLKNKGYQTACIGKWHLGLDLAFKSKSLKKDDYLKKVQKTPLDYGFDESFILPGSLNMAPYAYVEGEYFTEPATENFKRTPHNISIISGGPKAPNFNFELVVDTFTNKAIEFIKKASSKEDPFFLYFPLTAPHKPVIPAIDFIDKSKFGIYGDFVMQVDDVIGKITRVLKETGIEENTLLFYTSDNGSFMFRIEDNKPDHIDDFKVVGYRTSNHESNAIWRGTKADIYEAGHRVPFIVKWPKSIEKNSQTNQTICTTDIFSTVKDIIDNKTKHNEAEDSYSFKNILLKNKEKFDRPPIIHHSINGTFAIRSGDWKCIFSSGSGGRQSPKGKPFDGVQLYNLKEDPSEKNDLHKKYPEMVEKLRIELDQIIQKS